MRVKFSNFINRERTLFSWLFFIKFAWAPKHHGLSAAPSQERRAWTWQKDVPTYFSISKAVSHRHGRSLLPDRSDAGHGQMLKRQAASTAVQSSSNDMTWNDITSHHTSQTTTLTHHRSSQNQPQNTSPQQMPTLFESSEQRFNQSRLSQTIL